MEKDQYAKLIGLRIRQFRNERAISQSELADLSDLHRTYIGMIERGEKQITVWSLFKICKSLEIDIMEILDNG